jgi:hypothetical protein
MTMHFEAPEPGLPDQAATVPSDGAGPARRVTALDSFLAFSSEVTAFSRFELEAAGQARAYLATVVEVVGEDLLDRLFKAHASLSRTPDRKAQLQRDIFGDQTLGPIARNIIKLWYVGMWFQLPRAWAEAHGSRPADVLHTVSPEAYVEGLLWPAIGAHPPGAKAPGYGSWAGPPAIPDCTCEAHQRAKG